MLFVDGDHSYEGVLTDLNIYDPHSLDVCGHDLDIIGESVNLAVEDYYSTGLAAQLRYFAPSRIRSLLLRFDHFRGSRVKYPSGDSTIWQRLNT